jgi:hypothetical protein
VPSPATVIVTATSARDDALSVSERDGYDRRYSTLGIDTQQRGGGARRPIFSPLALVTLGRPKWLRAYRAV